MKRQRSNSTAKKPYRKKRSSSVKLSQGGVAGAANQMIPRQIAYPGEVKTFDTNLSGSLPASATLPWQLLWPNTTVITGQETILGQIVPGTSAFTRVGRQIRVVGIIIRGQMTTPTGSSFPNEGAPSAMDVIWDKQPNGAHPTIPNIYNASVVNSMSSLPNADFAKRFTFVKRLQISGRAGIPTATQIYDFSIKTNKLVNYDGAESLASAVETNNLLVTFSSLAASTKFLGTIRILYVDA